jgi:ABC-type polar amino acid transport system ATPase subunit
MENKNKTMTNNIIEINSLCKSFGSNVPILDDISLKIPKGSLITIIGRNGAGKTTLLKCIAGLHNINSGQISLNFDQKNTVKYTSANNSIRNQKYRKKIGFIFQNIALWPHFTILENVMRPLIDIHHMQKNDAIMMAHEWIVHKLKLKEYDLTKYPQELSIGMQRRVAIARTFATNPDILLIDELEANLDPEAVENVLNLIQEMFLEDPQKTMLMITHRIDFAFNNSTKVIALDKGRIVANDTPEKVLDNPQKENRNQFIKEIIEPYMSKWNFAFKSLETAVNIISLTSQIKDDSINIFQALSSEVLELLTKCESDIPHLVTIFTRDTIGSKELCLKGVSKSSDFVLDGEDVERFFGSLVKPEKATIVNGQLLVDSYKLIKDYAGILNLSEGVTFNSKEEINDSLISFIINYKKLEDFVYKCDPYPPIKGALVTPTPSKTDTVKKLSYFELSKATKYVYLIPMISQEQIIGILSIDTYTNKKWAPFTVKQLILLAKLGATAVKF